MPTYEQKINLAINSLTAYEILTPNKKNNFGSPKSVPPESKIQKLSRTIKVPQRLIKSAFLEDRVPPGILEQLDDFYSNSDNFFKPESRLQLEVARGYLHAEPIFSANETAKDRLSRMQGGVGLDTLKSYKGVTKLYRPCVAKLYLLIFYFNREEIISFYQSGKSQPEKMLFPSYYSPVIYKLTEAINVITSDQRQSSYISNYVKNIFSNC